ncbi:putative reverse transcriptase domain-containing protein [Tanacetum coccineum]
MNRCPKKVKQEETGEVCGQADTIKDAKLQGPNVVTGTFLLNNRYASILFDLGSDRSFMDTRFSSMLDIYPIKIDTSYEVELADGRIHDAVIICGEKVVRKPYRNKTLTVESDKGMSRLKVISFIKAYKYIEQGCHLFLAHVTEKKPKEKPLEDVPVIRDFPEVFPDDLPRLPPPRQVEFQIDLVPGAAHVARVPYRLAPSEMRELSVQLQELLEKGFICPSSSPWGTPDEEEHGKHLKIILELLKKERLYAKFSKCAFWLDSVQFLSHVVDLNGVHVDPTKIEAIKIWAAPTMPTEKDKKYEWEKEDEEAFQTLKQKLCSAPILAQDVSRFEAVILVPRMLASVSKCLTYAKVKAEHQKPSGLLQKPKIPVWKWERITTDFVSGLPRTPSGYDTIWVIVNRLTKLAHFLPMKKTDTIEKLTQLYLKEIVYRHSVPILIISDQDSNFTSRFWKLLQKALGMNLDMSIAYHPQMDGQRERTIQMLEDMLRSCVIDFKSSWDRHLPLVEFSYNNSYRASIKAAPYEALYERKCKSPVCWSEVRDRQLIGPKLIRETTEKIFQIKNHLLTSRSRLKSYADRRTKPLEFEVGDMVLLNISPWKGAECFGKHEKVSPRYIRPFKILARVGPVAYTLELLEELKGIHSTFHVLNLKKCLAEGNIVVPMDEIQLDDKLHMIKDPVEIVDREVKRLKKSQIPIVKVR